MSNLRIERILKMKNLEAFFLKKRYIGEVLCCMILLDYRRPSTLDDFPYLKNVEDPQEFGRSNFIKALILSEAELDTNMKEEIMIIASGFLENKPDCHWMMEFEQHDIHPLQVEYDILPMIKPILQRHRFSMDIEKIEIERFNFLSQD